MAATGELLPEDLEETLASFGNAVDNIDLLLQPLIDADFSSLQAQLSPEDKAQLLLALAYASNSLFWMYLNASGIDPRQHPVKNELDRVKGYMTKLKEAVAKGNEEKNPLKLDKAAANRFIKAGLVDADDDVKQQLSAQVRKAEKAQAKKAQPQTAEAVIADKIDTLAADAKADAKAKANAASKSKSAPGTPTGQKRKLEAAAEQSAQTTGKKKSKKSKK